MAITLSDSARIIACNAIADAVDADTSAGTIVIKTAGGAATLATLTFSTTAFGDASTVTAGARATANSITSDTSADATGTAATFYIYDGAANEIMNGSVGTSGADINLNTTSITAGDTVALSSFSITVY